jgi:hypothetical protein
MSIGSVWYFPSIVDDWHAQVVERLHVAMMVATIVSLVAGIAFWRRYPHSSTGEALDSEAIA